MTDDNMPEPDFWIDGGATPCFYESTVRAAIDATRVTTKE